MLHDLWTRAPRLIRLMLRHFLDGVVIGWSFGLLLLWRDVAGLGTLLASNDSAALTALFFIQGGLMFGTFGMTVAVMNMGDGDP